MMDRYHQGHPHGPWSATSGTHGDTSWRTGTTKDMPMGVLGVDLSMGPMGSPPGSNLVAGKVSGITGHVHPLKDGEILLLLHRRVP